MKTGKALIHEINSVALTDGQIAAWWLGQLGYAVKCGNTVIYLDMFLADHPKRLYPAPMMPEEVTNADLFFGSHAHADHIDTKSWPVLAQASPEAVFCVPASLLSDTSAVTAIKPERFMPLDDGVSFQFKDVTITGIPAAHETLDTDNYGRYLYSGILIRYGGRTIYHSGDCCIYDGLYSRLNRYKPFSLFCLPINGRDAERYRRNCIGNMTYQEAVDLTGAFKPDTVIPGHYDLMLGNTENVSLFTDYLEIKYPECRSVIPQYGEMILI